MYNNDFGDTKLKISYIWEYANRKGSIPLDHCREALCLFLQTAYQQ
jgi:hypothetical protein